MKEKDNNCDFIDKLWSTINYAYLYEKSSFVHAILSHSSYQNYKIYSTSYVQWIDLILFILLLVSFLYLPYNGRIYRSHLFLL